VNPLVNAQIAAMAAAGWSDADIDLVASDLVKAYRRQIVLTGLGKSGLVAQTAAALWTSVGLASRYIHPVDALHGDMAWVADDAVIIALSQSGRTHEVQVFLDHLMIRDGDLHMIVAVTTPDSPLARRATRTLSTECDEVLCVPAPFISTVMQRAWLDAICERWLAQFDVTALREEYTGNHPGGQIGKDMRT
jgi:arabinose-5-phosphate isomerase